MARVNVETRAFGEIRLRKFSKAMGWHRTTSLGVLVILWHESQEALAVDATRDQIIEWIDSDEDAYKIFDALVAAKYLTENEDGSFEIRGNAKHVEAMQKMQDGAKSGGRKSGAVRRTKTPPKNEGGVQEERTPVEANSLHGMALQGSSIHGSSSQGNTKQGELLPPDPSDPRPLTPQELNKQTWEAYSAAIKARWKEPPTRNAEVNGKIAQIVKRLGQDAPKVAEFYVWHNDQFYVRKLHPLGLLLADYQKIRTEWVTGKTMLGTKAREMERALNNRQNWHEAAEDVNRHLEEQERGQKG